MKKNILSAMLVLAIVLTMTVQVFANSEGEGETTAKDYATAKNATSPDSIKGEEPEANITYDNDHNITMTYTKASLKIVAANESIGRKVDAAWIGYELTAPEAATRYEATMGDQKASGDLDESKKVIDFVSVTKANLLKATKEGKELKYTITYKWEKEKETTPTVPVANEEEEAKEYETISVQTLNIVIDPAKVTLYSKDEKDTLWDNDDYLANKKVESKPATTTNTSSKKKDNTPDTGFENVVAVIGIVAMVTLAGIVILSNNHQEE